MKIIDLSKPIRYNKDDPWSMKVKVRHKPYQKTKRPICILGFPKRLFPKDLVGWVEDTIKKMGMHSTTHIGATMALCTYL